MLVTMVIFGYTNILVESTIYLVTLAYFLRQGKRRLSLHLPFVWMSWPVSGKHNLVSGVNFPSLIPLVFPAFLPCPQNKFLP